MELLKSILQPILDFLSSQKAWITAIFLTLAATVVVLWMLTFAACAFTVSSTSHRYYNLDSVRTSDTYLRRDSLHRGLDAAGNIHIEYPNPLLY